MDTIFEYLWVKATAVSMRLLIYLCALIYTNTWDVISMDFVQGLP
jgi:hypothetical protein